MEADSQAVDRCKVTLMSGETVLRFYCCDESAEEQSMLQKSNLSDCAAGGITFTNNGQPSQESQKSATRQYYSIGTQTDTPESACSVQTERDPTKNYSSTGTETDLNAIGDRKTLQTLLKWALSICSSEDSTPLIIPRFQEAEIQRGGTGAHSSLQNLERVHGRKKIHYDSRKQVADIESDGVRMAAGVTTNADDHATLQDGLRMRLQDQGASHQHPTSGSDITPIYTETRFEPLSGCSGTGQTGMVDQVCDYGGDCVVVIVGDDGDVDNSGGDGGGNNDGDGALGGCIDDGNDGDDDDGNDDGGDDDDGGVVDGVGGCIDGDGGRGDNGGIDGSAFGGGDDEGDDNAYDDGGASGLQSNPVNARSPTSAMPHQQLGSSTVEVTSDGPLHLFKCNLCPKRFKRQHFLYIHNYNSHAGIKPYRCTLCEERFPTRNSLKYHVNHYHKQTALHECHLCQKRFNHEGHFKRHLRCHEEAENGPYKCDKCDKSFQQEDILTKHINTHNWLKCQICEKSFQCKSALDRHAKVHSRECPFQCDVCSKRFKRYDSLAEHSLGHIGGKPYKCQECDQTFRTRSERWRHLKFSHLKDKH